MIEQPGVREQLQRQYDLKVLRLRLAGSGPGTQIVFELSCGGSGQVTSLTVPIEAIGLPSDADASAESSAQLAEERFHLPEPAAGAIRDAVRADAPGGAPLWLRLSWPTGLLAAVPWERLLQPLLGVPVLRLPYHLISPRAPQQELDCVICVSASIRPSGPHADLLDRFIEHIPPDLAQYATFHLFADSTLFPEVARAGKQYAGAYRIHIHPPPQDRHSRRGNPWLTWIRQALGDRSADVVHFLCDCYRLREQGALVLAGSPFDDARSGSAEPLFAADLVELLNATGAWSVAFTSLPDAVSAAAMRLLQDQLARLRPGPVLLHEMKHPDSRQALDAAYRFLYLEGQPPPNSPAVSLYTHPFPSMGGRTDDASEHLLNAYTLAERLGDRLTGRGDRPAWIAASQRVLEASAGSIDTAAGADPNSGKRRAREFVLKALADHADDPHSAWAQTAQPAGPDASATTGTTQRAEPDAATARHAGDSDAASGQAR